MGFVSDGKPVVPCRIGVPGLHPVQKVVGAAAVKADPRIVILLCSRGKVFGIGEVYRPGVPCNTRRKGRQRPRVPVIVPLATLEI